MRKEKNILKSIFEEKMLRMMLFTISNQQNFINGLYKDIMDRPLKQCFPDISRTEMNVLRLVK